MKWLLQIFVAFALLVGMLSAQPAPSDRFQPVDIFIDSRDKSLAAYQLEFSVKSGNATVVGVEGGERPAFKEAPFYDPKAIQQERVIIAAFSTSAADKLPKGKTRVATIHLQISGDHQPQFELKLETAASVEGKRISVEATFEERNAK